MNRPEKKPDTSVPVRWLLCILIAIPLIVLNCGWIAHSEMKTGVTEITISSLFTGVLFMLFILTLINLGVRRLFGGRTALNQPELMVLYSMLAISSSVAGIGNFGFFTPFLTNLFYYANARNGWAGYAKLFPAYIGPRSQAIIEGFYKGHSTFFRPEVMAAWALPLTAWGLFFLALLWTTLCASVILRRRWQEQEYLPFPVLALPLEITREGAPIYRNRLLWAGFAIPFFLHSLNTLHSLFPTLPSFPINRQQDLITGLGPPWSNFDSIPYLLHPAGVGFGYLINTDVLFSLWFFFVVKKALNFVGVSMNWRDAGHGLAGDGAAQFPFTGYQAWGAWLALCISTLYIGWPTFRDYLQRAWHGDPERIDSEEPMSARAAILGLVVGFLAICAFVWMAGGSIWLPVAFLGLYLLIMVALTRLHAETAVVSSYLMWVDPQSIITGLMGTVNMTKVDLAHTSMLSWFNLDYRAAAMPQQMEGMVGIRRAGGRMKPLVGAMMLAALVAVVAAILWDMQLYYVHGAATPNTNGYRLTMATIPWWTFDSWMHRAAKPDYMALPGMAVGAVITLGLAILRARFVGFPLVPAAYVLNISWANDLFWCDMLVAWVLKVLLLRYGGIRIYRIALPFFLGLILGDFVTGSVWSIVGAIGKLDLYRTFAN